MPVADAHVDVLYKMVYDKDIAFYNQSPLQASMEKLRAANVRTQVFALFVPAELPSLAQLEMVLNSIDTFYQKVGNSEDVVPVRTRRELGKVRKEDKLAGILSLEGGGSLHGDTGILRILFQLGVRGAGLTWNPANELADGCREPRNAGLTAAGKAVVKEMVRLGMWVDLAHLADTGVKDVLHLTDGVVMASHANARAVHQHPRNLTDETIREIISRRGWMGLTFEGSFIADEGQQSVDSLLSHLDYVLQLGGEDCVGFGSDFDGTTHPVPGLKHAGDYVALKDILVKRYGQMLAEKVLFYNFERFLLEVLPSTRA
ncbi:dipeptidase [Alicyclobacillus sp. SO9]|nr:dipeptidase [Alicyclobacillus sp. SO9]